MATTYTITVQSTAQGNKYFVNGVQQDSLTLQAGQSYIFDQSDASNAGHPLALSATSDGTHGGGSEYTYNVTKTGTVGTDRLLYFSPDNETTTSLYYYCEVHSGMGGSISVSPQTQIDPQVNFFKSTLSGTYADDATSLTISTGDGALLPDPSTDGEYNLTIFRGLQVNQNTDFEIVRVLSKSGDVLTVNRGIESTTALTVDSEVHSILMSATKKVFNDIDTQIDNLEVYDQTLNTTSDVAFNSVDVENTFLLPIKTSLPSSGTLGEMFYYSPKESMVFFDGSHFKEIDASYLVGLGIATATATANGMTLLINKQLATATAFANDATTTFLSSASRSLEVATATSSGLDAVADIIGVVAEYLVIAGGAGGGKDIGGGGGAGGYRSSVISESSGGGASAESTLDLEFDTNYTVTVGSGGAGGGNNGGNGTNSVFHTITSTGGGGGGRGYFGGISGGSGGGGGGQSNQSGGSGTANQGYGGGKSDGTSDSGAGGGGGASQSGFNSGSGSTGGNGGDGVQSSINGTATYRAGGGGGGLGYGSSGSAGSGGAGGGGNGNGGNGSANTGGGAGGGRWGGLSGGNGGSGVVILRYSSNFTISIGAGLTGSETTVGASKVATITAGTGNVSWSS